jgi:Protein of unknown function, DUF481.
MDAFAAKTDVITLRNGDRITGEVKQLDRGHLRLSTDDAGTIYIEWDKIASIKTTLPYEVVTSNGSRYVGVLATDVSDQLQVIADSGTVTPLPFLDVVEFWPMRSGFLQRIDGSFDLGGTYTRSSGVAQTWIDLNAAYRRPSYHVFNEFESNITRQQDVPSIFRFTLRTGYIHFLEDNWVVSPFAFIERNPDLGLDLRTAAVLVGGRYLQHSNSSTTLVTAGFAAGRERPIEGDTRLNLDAVVTFATSLYQHDYPRTTMDLSVMVFPELNNWGRVRSFANATIKRELFKDFFAGLTLYNSFDNRPPAPNVAHNDIGVSLSIGWTF